MSRLQISTLLPATEQPLRWAQSKLFLTVNVDQADAHGTSAIFVQTDVSSWSSLLDLFAETCRSFGTSRIDIVVANAGISQMRGFRTSEPRHFATSVLPRGPLALDGLPAPDLRVMDVNVTGSLYTAYLALAYFRRQGRDATGMRGRIVVTGSAASLYPFPNDALYAASKTALLGLVRSLGVKVAREGITVNALAPLVVRTNLGPADFFDRLEKEGRVTPMATITRCVDAFCAPGSIMSGRCLPSSLAQDLC